MKPLPITQVHPHTLKERLDRGEALVIGCWSLTTDEVDVRIKHDGRGEGGLG
jgi:hypothetical protein